MNRNLNRRIHPIAEAYGLSSKKPSNIFINFLNLGAMIKWNKLILERVKDILLNDTIWSVIGVLFGILNAFVHYFGDVDIIKAIFWMLCALVCIMNLKETPK